MDPLREADYDRDEAERLRYMERHENSPYVRADLEHAAQELDAEATQLEADAEAEAEETEE